jgi:hypothetical protein
MKKIMMLVLTLLIVTPQVQALESIQLNVVDSLEQVLQQESKESSEYILGYDYTNKNIESKSTAIEASAKGVEDDALYTYSLDLDDTKTPSGREFSNTGFWSSWMTCPSYNFDNGVLTAIALWEINSKDFAKGYAYCRDMEIDGSLGDDEENHQLFKVGNMSNPGHKIKTSVPMDSLPVGIAYEQDLLNMKLKSIAMGFNSAEAIYKEEAGMNLDDGDSSWDTLQCPVGYVVIGFKLRYNYSWFDTRAEIFGLKIKCARLNREMVEGQICEFFVNGEADYEGGHTYGGTHVHLKQSSTEISIYSSTVEVYQGNPVETTCTDSSAIACYTIECRYDPNEDTITLPD